MKKAIIFLPLGFMVFGEVNAEAFANYPGTRARAMGTAFTAIADDASAAWYNPAGLAKSSDSSITLEYSQKIAIEDFDESSTQPKLYGIDGQQVAFSNLSKEYDNSEDDLFFAANGSYEGFSMGVYYYSPNTFQQMFTNGNAFYHDDGSINTENRSGIVNSEIRLWGANISKMIWKDTSRKSGFLNNGSIGLGIEYVQMIDNGSISWSGQSSSPHSHDDGNGYAFNLGGLVSLYEGRVDGNLEWDVSLGATYRSESYGVDTSDYSDAQSDDDVLMGKPRSWDVGISYKMNNISLISRSDRLIVSAQYGESDYSTASEIIGVKYKKIAVGAEYWMPIGWEYVKDVAVRVGWYQSNSSNASYDVKGQQDTAWPDSSAITFGVGVGLTKNLSVDLAYERRSIEDKYCTSAVNFATWQATCSGDMESRDFDANLVSFSIRYIF